jgi:hypothetical protein
MADPIVVLTRPPVPVLEPQTPVTLSVKGYLDRELIKYIQKSEFSENSVTATCFVLDGGNSNPQPCDG